MTIKEQIEQIVAERKRITRILDVKIANLQDACEHKNPPHHKAGDGSISCVDCGKWWYSD